MDTKCMEIDELFYGTVTVGERGQIVVPAQARVAGGPTVREGTGGRTKSRRMCYDLNIRVRGLLGSADRR